MGNVLPMKAPEPSRDRWGRVCLEVGQRWVCTGEVWVIAHIEIVVVNDKKRTTVHLQDLDGVECASTYSEKYFRKWFQEIDEPRRKDNRARQKSKNVVRNFDHWLLTGPVISSTKK